MKALLGTTAVLGLMLLGIFTASIAHADPSRCEFYWQCQPSYNGPLMPTWDVPGVYGGWNNDAVTCDPFNYACRIISPQPNGSVL